MKTKTAYIMRGVSGSGKSPIARKLTNEGNWGTIHSTNDFFYANGQYCFDPEKLEEYHDQNFKAFCESLTHGAPFVVCDNPNIKRQDFEHYVEAAKGAGYIVAFVVMPHPAVEIAAQRSIHKVSEAMIQRMIQEWES